jgi:hypothetical protein
MIGVAVVASKDHHPAAVQPAPRVTPPPAPIIHQAPFHFPLTGTQIVWIVVILAVAVVAIRINKYIHS